MSQFIHLRNDSINSEWTYKTEWERCAYFGFQTKYGKWREVHYLDMSYKHFDRIMSSVIETPRGWLSELKQGIHEVSQRRWRLSEFGEM